MILKISSENVGVARYLQWNVFVKYERELTVNTGRRKMSHSREINGWRFSNPQYIHIGVT